MALLDTGSEVCVGNEALRRRLEGHSLVDARQVVQLQSVTGDMISGDYMFVRKLRISGITLENLAVVFVDTHTFKQLKLDKTPALLLGMNAFRAFKKVSIDFANRRVEGGWPVAASVALVAWGLVVHFAQQLNKTSGNERPNL